ncbi:MAG: hypothetical protein AAB263_12635, partial [Planctomycetota bacterium]
NRTLAGNITTTGARTLTLGSSVYWLTLTGVMSDGTGALSLNMLSSVSTTGAHTCTGSVTVSGGALEFQGAYPGGSMLSISSLEINNGGTLFITSNTEALDDPNRLANGLSLTMRGGSINITVSVNQNRARQERIGVLNIAGGDNVFTFRSTNYTGSMTFLGNVVQSNGGRLTFNRINSNTNSSGIFFTGMADGTILPWATVFQTGVDGPRIGKYTTASGLIACTAIVSAQTGNWDDVATWVGGVVPAVTDEVTIASNHAVDLNGADRTADSLTFSGGGSVTGANTLTLTSGGVYVNGTGAPTISSNLDFGAADGIITQNSSGTLTVSGIISGSGHLNIIGAGTVSLGGTNTVGGAGKTVNVGSSTLILAADANLGDAANTLVLGGSVLQLGNGFTSARAISLLATGATMEVAGAATATLTSAITGTGAVTKRGTGVLVLGGNSSYSGLTT